MSTFQYLSLQTASSKSPSFKLYFPTTPTPNRSAHKPNNPRHPDMSGETTDTMYDTPSPQCRQQRSTPCILTVQWSVAAPFLFSHISKKRFVDKNKERHQSLFLSGLAARILHISACLERYLVFQSMPASLHIESWSLRKLVHWLTLKRSRWEKGVTKRLFPSWICKFFSKIVMCVVCFAF